MFFRPTVHFKPPSSFDFHESFFHHVLKLDENFNLSSAIYSCCQLKFVMIVSSGYNVNSTSIAFSLTLPFR